MLIRMLLFGLTVCSCLRNLHAQIVERWLESTRYTNWGDWGAEELCPPNSWVSGMNLKIEDKQGSGDDTALNGIQLICTDLNLLDMKTISSSEGPWGNQRGRKDCNGYATAFKLKSEPSLGDGDDVGAVNLKLECLDFDSKETEITGWDLPWGEWSEYQRCPPRTAICGIRTQVEKSQGRGDDTSLNNVDIACCKVPHPADNCIPSKKWKTIISCHSGVTDCTVAFKTGLTVSDQLSQSVSNSVKFHESYGGSFGAEYTKGLLKNSVDTHIEFGEEKVNGKTLGTIVSETNVKETEIKFTVGCVGAAEELVVLCGPYELGTNEFRCTPNPPVVPIPPISPVVPIKRPLTIKI